MTFEYDADNADELTIRVGEIVEIVNKNTDSDGWWEVRWTDTGIEYVHITKVV